MYNSNFHLSYRKQIRFLFAAWLAYFLVFNIHSFFWREFQEAAYTPLDSVVWFAKEWGTWLIISPLLILALIQLTQHIRFIFSAAALAFPCLAIAIWSRMLMDSDVYSADYAGAVFSYIPKYAATYSLIVLVWHFKYGASDAAAATQDDRDGDSALDASNVTQQTLDAIEVEHNGLPIMLPLDDIDYFKSAGNYVEISCAEMNYLKRSTLQELATLLPELQFMRVHRSYTVNLAKAYKLLNTDNGAGTLILHNQKQIAVSKTYKSALKQSILSRSTIQ